MNVNNLIKKGRFSHQAWCTIGSEPSKIVNLAMKYCQEQEFHQ